MCDWAVWAVTAALAVAGAIIVAVTVTVSVNSDHGDQDRDHAETSGLIRDLGNCVITVEEQ